MSEPGKDESNPETPDFEMLVDGERVALLYDYQWDDMFWASYRVAPVSDAADKLLRDEKVWYEAEFTVRDMDGKEPNPHTFSSGDIGGYCDCTTDRISFRSLFPARVCRSSFQRFVDWVLGR